MRNASCRLVAALLILATALPAGAEWKPTPPPLPGQSPSTGEGQYGAPDRGSFEEDHRKGVLTQICSHLDGEIDFSVDSGFFTGTGVKPRRRLEQYENRSFAIVDSIAVKIAGSKGWNRPVGGDSGANVSLSVGASIDGMMEVVRPTGSKNSCAMVPRLLRVNDFKIPYPFTADRIRKMQVGELWSIPMSLTLSGGGGAGISKGHVSFNWSRNKSEIGTAALTVYRVSETLTRLRFRTDYVSVSGESMTGTFNLSPIEVATDGRNAFTRFFQKELAHEVARWTSIWITKSKADSSGERLVLEFQVNPNDPVQAGALVKALEGNFIDVLDMAKDHMGPLKDNSAELRETFEKQKAKHAKLFGKGPAFMAVDASTTHVKSYGVHVPVLVDATVNNLFGDNRVTVLHGGSGVYRYDAADDNSAHQFLTLPRIKALVKESVQNRAEAVTVQRATGLPYSDPILVYMRNQAVLRLPGSAVQGSVEEVNQTLRLAGAQRGAEPGRIEIKEPVTNPPTLPKDGGQEWSDRKGMMAMTLVFNEKAVRDAANATPQQLLQAYAAVVDPMDRALVGWLTAYANAGAKGLEFDERAAAQVFRSSPYNFEERDKMQDLRQHARTASALIADYAELRDSSGERRGRALAKLLTTKESRTELGVEKGVKIFVQLVDPCDITGDWSSGISGGGKPVNLNRSLIEGCRQKVQLLKEAGDVRSRFARGSRLRD